jgi:hypothetical protein
MKKLKVVLLLGCIGISLSYLLPGQELDLLVSPGKLAKVHAQFSGIDNCTKCHTAGKQTDPAKCLECHKDLAARINQNKGYHRDKKQDCISCHPEHNGEDFQLIHWKPASFDHNKTGYPLTGLHRKVTDCSRCHTPLNTPERKKSKSYLLKDARCAACHKDAHKGQLGTACDKCHGVDTPFKEVTFNHDKSAFPLKGAHVKTACVKCHKEKKWIGLRFASCVDCHADPHRPPFKEKCSQCHNENSTSWKVSTFDHNRTRYPLLGKHAALSCERCHPPNQKLKKMPFARCDDCHRKDPHNGQFDRDCSACHVVQGFRETIYNHDSGRYPLTGKHRSVACKKCHYPVGNSKTVIYKPLVTNCSGCHKDIHLRQFEKKCDACHTTDGFKRGFLQFDHQRNSNYPLQGKHTTVPCEKCHLMKKENFPGGFGEAVRYRPLSDKCSACHEDFHQGQLKNDCRKCHGFDSFKSVVSFDHQQTRFPLDLLHKTVDCAKCHPRVRLTTVDGTIKETIKYKSVGTTCMDCHRSFDHSTTAFTLTGRHRDQDCGKCHNQKTPHTRKTRKIRGGEFACRHCHASPHPGNLSQCVECHTTKTWKVDNW